MANKTSNKKSNKSLKKNQAVIKRANAPRPSPRVSRASVEMVCSLSDPFCRAALGAKYPSGASARTLSFPFHTRTVLTTDAAGSACMGFVPNYLYLPFVPANMTTTTSATFFALTGAGTIPNVVSYRITTFGVILRNTATPLNSSGMVRIRGFSNKAGATLQTLDVTTYSCDYYEDVPLSKCSEVCVIAKRLDDTASFLTSPSTTSPAGNVSDWISPGHGFFTVAITGGPVSVSPLDIEIFINYELVLADNDGLALLAVATPPYNSALKEATNDVASTLKPVFMAGVKSVATAVGKAAIRGIASAIGAKLGGANGARAGYMITDAAMEVD